MTDTTPTPADRPADQLRAAAEKLRAAAGRATRGNGSWRYTKGLPNDSVRTEAGWEIAYGDDLGSLGYIALMHPGVGLALADSLESTARTVDAVSEKYEPDPAAHWLAPALAVARQLLGTTVAEGAVVLEPQDHPGADLFAALQHAGLDVDEANRRMYAYAGMVLRQEKALAASPAPTDRAAVLREAADLLAELGTPIFGERSEHERGLMYGAERLRRLAAEPTPPAAPAAPEEPQ
ncbi:hypothetical protein ACWHA3_01035 [Streptomyces cyaneofuscatus]